MKFLLASFLALLGLASFIFATHFLNLRLSKTEIGTSPIKVYEIPLFTS